MSLRVGIPSIGMRAAGTVYQRMELAAREAARRNNAALWYVGSDPDGWVYEDSTGTLNATGTDPVGLLLDRSRVAGEQYGAPVFINDFSIPGDWTLGAGWSVSGGVATKTGAGVGQLTSNAAPLTAGKYYRVTATYNAVSGTSFNVVIGSGTYTNLTIGAGVTTASVYGFCTGAPFIGFQSGADYTIDNLVIQEAIGTLGQNYAPALITGVGWGVDTGVAVGSGVATWTAAATNAALYGQNVPTGASYLVEFDILSISGGLSGGVGNQSGGIKTTVGHYSSIVTNVTNATIAIRAVGTTTATIANFTFKQLLGYPALQATAANKPTLELQANGYYGMRFDGVNDFLLTSRLLGAEAEIGTAFKPADTNDKHLMGDIPASVNSGYLLAGNLTDVSLQTFTPQVVTTRASAVSVVASAWAKAGQAQEVRSNGVLTTGAVSSVIASALPLRLGSSPSGFGFSNSVHLMFWASPAKLPTADRIAIERFAALLSGASYV